MQLAITTILLLFSSVCLRPAAACPTMPECQHVVCLDIHDPVCGSDGHLYHNRCYLKKANCRLCGNGTIHLANDEMCGANLSTTPAYTPTVPCPTPGCQDLECPDDCDPVCGSDGRLYHNQCYLEQANCHLCGTGTINRVKDEMCQANLSTTTVEPETTTPLNCENIPCPIIFKPVCGSDGKTYSNACVLGAENCKRGPDDEICIEHEGFCSQSQPETTTMAQPETTTLLDCDNIPCALIFEPVCGSDGETYSNACVLRAENCKRGPDDEIIIEHEGFCSSCSSKATSTVEPETTTPLNCENIPCPLIFMPVCGSDGQTYSNACVLGAENCKRGPDDEICIEHEGFCSPSQPETTTVEPETTTPLNCENIPCPLIFKPVCGSDGKTYSNACVLGAENCKRGPDDEIFIEHAGFCSPSQPETTTVQPETTMPYNCDYIPCPLLFNPVCGSDGVIYSNACVLGVENCNRGPDDKITIDGWRSCGFFK